MKRVVLNRKNSLFVRNARGGRTAAILASLTSTCQRHGAGPHLYLTQLPMNVPSARAICRPGYQTSGSGITPHDRPASRSKPRRLRGT
jgi:hypothetical protein